MSRIMELVICAAIMVGLAASGVCAQKAEMYETVKGHIEAAKVRLELSDADAEKAEPVIRAGVERRLAILEKHGLINDAGQSTNVKPPANEMKTIGNELEDAQKDIVEQLSAILSKKQVDEYKKLQDEAREQIRERFRN